ncbi:RNA polymerase alpha subunit C-terminal domain-containing protein [Adhaeribacter sp. BT258]|uniref:RNA polymerase alpha subunit C-terminal domain-containing protein n=1 Tax=Adhaeribacter terrigena TaxID=2793070 RepID=A0ABS1BYU9_9BACT|nr:RNA polymerase alpha subunit C-terminal domain-containing protein [Adhaeribacter terrigena]MBK0402218.1 RNA polymerase alpha subunit C-terminal domain-containing protein [Adhaeribacter terrigena]
MKAPQLKTYPNGHQFYKSSDCPTCPVCDKESKPEAGFLATLSAPARRALENNNIFTLEQLSALSEKDVLKFHGMGKASLPKLRETFKIAGLTFKTHRLFKAERIAFRMPKRYPFYSKNSSP